MGDLNQLDFILENRHRVEGPVLEIGSKDYGNASDLRSLFPDLPYTGIDLEAGDGVDTICDFTRPLDEIEELLGSTRYRTIVCFSVMEHCEQPFKMAGNITSLLEPGGVLFISVPWVWNIHGYPDDYWRFTPAAIRLLFADLEVIEDASFWSTKNRGERFPLTVKKLNMNEAMFFKTPEIAADLRRRELSRFEHPYYCYPVMLNMLLVKMSETR